MVIRHNHYLDLGNGSNKFGNHCYNEQLNAFAEKLYDASVIETLLICTAQRKQQNSRNT